jgi:putative transposase
MNENDRAMKKQHVKLIDTDREFLENLIGQGKSTAKAYRRALALLELDRGQTYTEVSKILQVTIPTISSWAKKYQEIRLKSMATSGPR